MKYLISVFVLCLIQGCVSVDIQKVTAVDDGDEICMIRNKAVRDDFFDAYQSTLIKAGFTTREISEPSECRTYTTYVAYYGIHWGLYLSRAELKIYKDNELAGSASYRAPRADPSKHGRVEDKVQNLVNQMFSR